MRATHRATQHRRRAIVALLLAALAALTLAACGSGDKGGGSGGGDATDARAILRETFSGAHDVRSGRADVRLTIDETGGAQYAIGIAGPFQTSGADALPKFDLALDARLGGTGSFQAGLTSTSDRLFVQWAGTAYEVPAQLLDDARRSVEQAQRDASGQRSKSLAAFGIDPQDWVQDPKVVGQEDVGGVSTDHVSAAMNVGAFLDSVDKLLAEVDRQGLGAASGQNVPSRLSARDRAQIERAVRQASVEVWSGHDDHTLRKIHVRLDVKPVGAGARGGSVDFAFQVSGVNEAQTIEAPAHARPIDELLGQFQGLLGGTGLGSGSSGAYQDCIARAAGDLEQAQRCASLLTR